jgi:sugar phosphate isomerase/epimerase
MRERQLGVQAHCLRFRITASLEATLAEVARLGLRAIELVTFPGCRGNRWGDFGAATDWPPEDIGRAIRCSGLACPSALVTSPEIAADRFEATVSWLRAAGIPRLILTSMPTPGSGTLRDWQQAFAALNTIGERLGACGMQFAIHTQPNLWAVIDHRRLADELLRAIDPELCRVEFDPSGAIMYGTDPAQYISQRPDCFYALHLRDGTQPPEPVFYQAAEPLGAGTVDWPALLAAAEASAIEWYFLEMEVTEPAQTMAAIIASQHYLRERGLVRPG